MDAKVATENEKREGAITAQVKEILAEVKRIASNGDDYLTRRQLDAILTELNEVRRMAKKF